jgi:excisionase family DNA binding protein
MTAVCTQEKPMSTPPRSTPHLISLREAATLLAISERTLRGLVASGALRVIRISARRIAVDVADLRSYIESRRS